MAVAQARRTHCPRGHEYDEQNTCRTGGRRHCLACQRERRAERAKPKPTLLERLMARVEVQPDGCWCWTGSITNAGYGALNGRMAHRLMYEEKVGSIPVGLLIDHTCHNGSGCPGGSMCPHRRCVNPDHLEPVTRVENVMRGEGFGAVNARKTLCPAGHEYTPENTWVSEAGWRECRTCHREAARTRRLTESSRRTL